MSLPIVDDVPAQCRFCQHCYSPKKGGYQCRYRPKQITGFPIVLWNDWCSKYKPDQARITKHLERKAREAEIVRAIARKPE